MKEKAERGRSRRRRSLKRLGKRNVKQLLSVVLCASMVGTGNAGGMLTVLAQEEGQVFHLSGDNLARAITDAAEDESAKYLGYEFSGAEKENYEELFSETEYLYELSPEVIKDSGSLNLKVFAKLDSKGFQDDSYQITGDEELIFLLENDTEETVSGRIIVDQLETEVITVEPKTALVSEELKEKLKEIGVETPAEIPETDDSDNAEAVEETETEEETEAVGTPEKEDPAEETEDTETDDSDSTEAVEETETEEETEVAETLEEEDSAEDAGDTETDETIGEDSENQEQEETIPDTDVETETGSEGNDKVDDESDVSGDQPREENEETSGDELLSLSRHEAPELAATPSEWRAAYAEEKTSDLESASSVGSYYNSVIVDEKMSAAAFTASAEELELTGLDLSGYEKAVLKDGINIVKDGAENKHYQINEGKAVMISGQDQSEDNPIVFKDCVFELVGGTMRISGNQDGISYNKGEVVTKLWIGGNVKFDHCVFVADDTEKTTSAGYDAAIYFFSGDIVLNDCDLSRTNGNGQFLGLYGSSGSVTFNNCNISTEGNRNGWSYAMYGGSVLKLKESTMTATGMAKDGKGNINAFYSGDNRTGYDAIFIEDSTVDFHDNQAGGFAINNVNIYVKNSTIRVNDNLGNACNSGYWIVEDNSSIIMDGNRGGHALSCIGVEMKDSSLEILHNGYAGLYIQSKDSTFVNSKINIRCNGEKLLSYSAGDVWLNEHKATFTDCPSVWLGAVGRKGKVVEENCDEFVAVDLNDFAVDNLKSNTAPILEGVALDGDEEHILILNNRMKSDYARGNGEVTASSNDVDLFADDEVSMEAALGKDTAKIGSMTDAQLSHHKYDWNGGKVATPADMEHYGAWAYPCTDVCAVYEDHTGAHLYSFDCEGTYVYGPLVGLAFDANAGEDSVTGMPEDRTALFYGNGTASPSEIPVRLDNSDEWDWKFTGWYTDRECTQKFDFASALTDNWTVVYAGWIQAEPEPEPTPDPDPSNPGNHGGGSSGSSGGSGSISTPVTEITPDSIPLAPGPSETVISMPEEIPEEAVPLSPLPKTGERMGRKEVTAFFAGILAILYLGLTRKKGQDL